MPWDGTELWAGATARPTARWRTRDWSRAAPTSRSSSRSGRPTASLYFVSDRTGWWNLYRLAGDGRRALVADGGRVRAAAVGLRHVDLRLRVRRRASSAPTRRTGPGTWRSLDTGDQDARPSSTRPTPRSAASQARAGRVAVPGAARRPSRRSLVQLDLATRRDRRCCERASDVDGRPRLPLDAAADRVPDRPAG